MKCKPGDLAIFVRDPASGPSLLGTICTVIKAAPQVDFSLPDGTPHAACLPGRWVLEFPSPVQVDREAFGFIVGTTLARYACGPDFALRPLRDNPGQDETLTWRDVPTGVTA